MTFTDQMLEELGRGESSPVQFDLCNLRLAACMMARYNCVYSVVWVDYYGRVQFEVR